MKVVVDQSQCWLVSRIFLLLSIWDIVEAESRVVIVPLAHSQCMFSNSGRCSILLLKMLHLGVLIGHRESILRHLLFPSMFGRRGRFGRHGGVRVLVHLNPCV